jgi:lysophospholipase L1-like esterase
VTAPRSGDGEGAPEGGHAADGPPVSSGVLVRLETSGRSFSSAPLVHLAPLSGGDTITLTLADDGNPPDVGAGDGVFAADSMIEADAFSVTMTVEGEKLDGGEVSWDAAEQGARDLDIVFDGSAIRVSAGVPAAGLAPNGGPATGGGGGAAVAGSPGGTPTGAPSAGGPAALGPGAVGDSSGLSRRDALLWIALGLGLIGLATAGALLSRWADNRSVVDLTVVPEPSLFGAPTPSLSDGLSVWQVAAADRAAMVRPLLASLARHHPVLVVAPEGFAVPSVFGGPVYVSPSIEPEKVEDALLQLADSDGPPPAALLIVEAPEPGTDPDALAARLEGFGGLFSDGRGGIALVVADIKTDLRKLTLTPEGRHVVIASADGAVRVRATDRGFEDGLKRRAPSRRRRGRKRLPLLFKVTASAFVLVCFLVVVEGLARLTGPLVPVWQGADNGGVVMTGHPERLWGMGSGVRANGGTTATISPTGLREPLPVVPRPEGRKRLMILGDSSFFGHGVSDDQTLGAQLQDTLVSRGVDVDVVNGAIPGYSTEQSLMLLDDLGWPLEPTLLIVGNLWSDNNFDLFRDADLLRTRKRFTSGLAAKSAFVRLLAGWLDGFRSDQDARVVTWTRSSELPESGVRRVSVHDYARNLDRMTRRARERGVGLILLAPSNRDTVSMGRADDQVWMAYFDAQVRISECHGVPRADTLPALQAAAAAGATLDDLFIDEMHPTTRGHGVLAGAVADTLLGAGWPEDPLLGREEPCSLDGIVDPFPEGRSDAVNQLSPQANLYPHGGGPGGLQANTVPDGERLPPGAWVVSGQVEAVDWPVRVAVLDMEGRPLVATEMAGPGEDLKLIVFNGLDRVEVLATDAAGVAATVTATPKTAEVSLVIGGAAP